MPFAASDFVSVLLSKTVRSSSTLKLAFVYVIAFCAAIFGLLGYVYWSTVTYLHKISDRAISIESDLLTKAYESGGRDGLVTFINRRLADAHFSEWAYLLVDHSFDYIAGNLKGWPASFSGQEGWSTLASVDWQSEPARRPPVRVKHQLLADGNRLLLGRDNEDLDRFSESVTIGLASAAVIFLILAAAAGISTSRRSVARIEAINATSREIMRSGLGERIPLRGTGDEWDGLAENLNSMLDRIVDKIGDRVEQEIAIAEHGHCFVHRKLEPDGPFLRRGFEQFHDFPNNLAQIDIAECGRAVARFDLRDPQQR